MRDLSGDHRWLSLNTATVRKQGSLLDIIEACARHGIRAIDPWRDQVASTGIERAAKAIRDAGLELSGYCRGGMFTAPDNAERQAALDDNRRAVDEALALNAECLVLVVGGLAAGSKDIADARQQVRDGIASLLDYSRAQGMKLAIEPLHPMYAADRACVNTLKQANDLCQALGAGIGVDYGIYLWSRMQEYLEAGDNVHDAYLKTMRVTGASIIFTGITLAIGVVTWVFSPLQFQADIGIMLTFMFFVNMLGAIILLPALAAWFVRPRKVVSETENRDNSAPKPV